MDPNQEELAGLLKQSGAVLERKRKHCVWRLPDGSIFVHAATPSDNHAWANALREFRRLRGLNEPDRGSPGPRRERKGNRRQSREPVPAVLGTVRVSSLTEALASLKFMAGIATVESPSPRILDVPELATEAKCPPQLIPTSLPRLQGPASALNSPFLRRLLDWLW